MIIKWTCENFIYWIVTTYTFQVLKKVKCHWDEFYESKFFRSLQKSLEKLDEKVGETRGDVGNCRVLLNISLFVGLKWIASSRQSGILVEVKRGVDKLGVGDSFQEILFFFSFLILPFTLISGQTAAFAVSKIPKKISFFWLWVRESGNQSIGALWISLDFSCFDWEKRFRWLIYELLFHNEGIILFWWPHGKSLLP